MRLLRAFVSGLMEPSWAGTLGALALGVLLFAAAATGITPQWMGTTAGHQWLSTNADHDAVVTVDALRTRYHTDGEVGVAYLGASGKRAAIVSAASATERLSGAVGQDAVFHMWTTNGQNLLDSALMIDQLPADWRGVICLGVGARRLSTGAEQFSAWVREDRMAVPPSPLVDRELGAMGLAPPERFGAYLLDHAGFFASRYYAPLLGLARGDWYLEQTVKGRASEKQWARYEQQTIEFRERMELNQAGNLELVERIATQAKSHPHATVVLLESPIPKRTQRLMAEPYTRYREAIVGVARRAGVAYLDLRDAAGIEDDDFRDATHISNPEARARFEAALIDALAPLVRAQAEAP